jgi:2-(1,2-epoxy-1,2-dihydrophenyl)acetyl-CoA isomerase
VNEDHAHRTRPVVLFDRSDDGVVKLTLHRPESLNALTQGMMEELLDHLRRVKDDDQVGALVLTGSGRGFCAGGDFKDQGEGVLPLGRGEPHRFLVYYREVIREITLLLRELRVPTVAAVNGPAYGQGFDLALACDIRVASKAASFCAAWLRRAAVPAAGTTFLLPQLIGMSRAAEILLSARTVDAEEAAAIGLVSSVLPPEDFDARTMQLATRLARGPRVAQWLTKEAMYAGVSLDIRTALNQLAALQVTALAHPDYAEASAAFVEGRPPTFHREGRP